MALSPRSIAVEGLGFGPAHIARLGFFGFEVVIETGGSKTKYPWPQKSSAYQIRIMVKYNGVILADAAYVVADEKISVTARLIGIIYDTIMINARKLASKFKRPTVEVKRYE